MWLTLQQTEEKNGNVAAFIATKVFFHQRCRTHFLPPQEVSSPSALLSSPQLLGEDRFQDIEKIKTIGSTYMAVSGLSPEKQVSVSRSRSGASHTSCF